MAVASRYLTTYQTLKDQRSWYETSQTLCAAHALLLVLGHREDRVGDVLRATEKLKEASQWFSSLRGVLGESLAVFCLARGVDPALVPPRSEAVRARFKESELPYVGPWAVLGSAVLGLEEDALIERALPRISSIYHRWQKDHPWLTGGDDLVAAVLHALESRSPGEVAQDVEDRYRALNGAGAARGNSLQRAAQFGALGNSLPANVLAGRFGVFAEHLKRLGYRRAVQYVDATCLVAMVDGPIEKLAEEVFETLETISRVHPWVDQALRFNMATALVVSDRSRGSNMALQSHLLLMVVSSLHSYVVVPT